MHLLDRAGAVSPVIPKRRGIGGMALHASGGLVVGGRDIAFVALASGEQCFDMLQPARKKGQRKRMRDGEFDRGRRRTALAAMRKSIWKMREKPSPPASAPGPTR